GTRAGASGGAASLEALRQLEREVQALAAVEARIAHRLVPERQVVVRDRRGPAQALGDVVARQLDVDAAGPGALGGVRLEEPCDLGEDVVEVAGLAAGARR